MVLHQKDLITHPAQKPKLLQPDCPVYLHAYVRTVTKQELSACVQMRFINRCEQTVESLFLRVRGIDAQGNTSFEQNDVALTSCHAEPHTVFGEEQPIFLPRRFAEALEITVERVLFEDGMIWRRMPSHLLLRAEDTDWIDCECGMKNPPNAAQCAFCGKPIVVCEAEEIAEEPIEEVAEPEEVSEEIAVEEVEEAIAEEPIDEPIAEEPIDEPQEEPAPVEEALPIILPIVEEVFEPVVEEIPEPVVEECVEDACEPMVEECIEEVEAEAIVEEATEPMPVAEVEPEAEVEPAPEGLEDAAEEPACVAEVVSPVIPACDIAQCEEIMSETAALLRELMARSAAIKGEPLPTAEEPQSTEPEAPQEPEAAPRKRKTLLIIFWVLFILTLVAVGLLFYFNPNGLLY